MFLFHTGSIKSDKARRHIEVNGRFLFHTGSIKSPALFYRRFLTRVSFYSILVRLKVTSSHFSRFAHRWSFYSILVRLKDKKIHLLRDVKNSFLFHTGSIKRKLEVQVIVIWDIGFYSILVRLKGNKIASHLSVSEVSIPYWFD